HVNVMQASKVPAVGADPLRQWGRPPALAKRVSGWNTPAHERHLANALTGVCDDDTRTHGGHRNTRSPRRGGGVPRPDAREGQAGSPGVADRPVVPSKPGN